MDHSFLCGSVVDLVSGKVGSCLGRQIFRGGNFRAIFYWEYKVFRFCNEE